MPPALLRPLTLALLLAQSVYGAGVDYLRDVKPILTQHCVRCHGEAKIEAGLRVDTAAALREGGDNGSALRPREGGESLLLQVITGQHADIAKRATRGGSVKRYVQNHIIEEPPPGYPFDAVQEIWFDGPEAVIRSFADPALAPIAQDLAAFCDMQKSVTLAAEVVMRRENP